MKVVTKGWHLRPECCDEGVANVFEQDKVDKRIHCRVEHLIVWHNFDDLSDVNGKDYT